MEVINKYTKEELARFDCRKAAERERLFRFFVEWSRSHPPPAPRPAEKKTQVERTAAAVLAERATRSRGRKLSKRRNFSPRKSGLSAVVDDDEDLEGLPDDVEVPQYGTSDDSDEDASGENDKGAPDDSDLDASGDNKVTASSEIAITVHRDSEEMLDCTTIDADNDHVVDMN